MKYDFGNQYEYFSDDIDDQFPEPPLDELDIHVFVDALRGHIKISIRSITRMFSVVGSAPKTWSSKINTVVQTSTFGAKFTALEKVAKDSVMFR